MAHQAILDENFNIIEVDDMLLWAKQFEKMHRRLWYTVIEGYKVSTVFLGLDYGWGGQPQWFETMVFPPQDYRDLWMRRAADLANAYGNHKRGEAWLRSYLRSFPITLLTEPLQLSYINGSP